MVEFNEIANVKQLADFLKVSSRQLNYLLYTEHNLYKEFKIAKSSGGFRTISAPVENLKSIQSKLSSKILKHLGSADKKKLLNAKISHGFTRDKSIITNAQVHRNKRILLNLDLEDFFKSIHFGRVRGYFNKNHHFKLTSEASTMIAQITCHEGFLPQGAPTSPIISNLIANILDMRLLQLTKKYKLDYTRYVDDLTFSTNELKFIEQKQCFLAELEKIINASGFSINSSKSHTQYGNSRQTVTGLTVNEKINTKKEFRKNTRAMAHSLYTRGYFKIAEKLGTLNQLEGRFSFINQLDIYNNNNGMNNKEGLTVHTLNSREREYQQFLFYKYFIVNSKPLIITEGKTDIKHLQIVLEELKRKSSKAGGNNITIFEVDLLNRFKSKRNNYKMNKLDYFLDSKEGVSGITALLEFYSDKGNPLLSNYWKKFTEIYGLYPQHPVVLLLDNEKFDKSPLNHFLNRTHTLAIKQKESIEDDLEEKKYSQLLGNLYLLPLLRKNDEDTEIENLYDESTISAFLNTNGLPGKKIYDNKKNKFAEWLSKNIEDQELDKFADLFEVMIQISNHYQNQLKIRESNI